MQRHVAPELYCVRGISVMEMLDVCVMVCVCVRGKAQVPWPLPCNLERYLA